MAWVSWPTQGDIEGVLIEDEPQGDLEHVESAVRMLEHIVAVNESHRHLVSPADWEHWVGKRDEWGGLLREVAGELATSGEVPQEHMESVLSAVSTMRQGQDVPPDELRTRDEYKESAEYAERESEQKAEKKKVGAGLLSRLQGFLS